MSEHASDLAELFPDEVVTRAPVRYFPLPPGPDGHTPGTFALITLDNGFDHTKPSTFGPRGLAELGRSLDEVAVRAAAGELVGVGVTGKPFVFAVGADLKGVGLITDRAQALAIGRLGHDVFRRLGELPVPSFAFVNGAAMGGGLEVALHCTYRTACTTVPAVSLPECFLGLVPGWGGTYLLPNLIGPERAVKVIIENALSQNRQLKGGQLREFGIADALFDGAEFLAESLRWATRVITGETVVERAPVARDEESWEAAVAAGRAFADGKVGGAAPAPYRALDLVSAARTADRDAGFAAEDEALADLIMSEELRSGLYAFNLVQKRARKPVGAPDPALARPVTKVGVVGAGLMATQLAQLLAHRLEVPVTITDLDQERVDRGLARVREQFDLMALRGRLTADRANRLKALVTGVTDKAEGFTDVDLVIEAVFEEMSVKQKVLAEVEAIVPPECTLATNTSSLSVTEMASQLAHPERVVGLHFFNPVALMPLLEVVRAERTDDTTLATAFAVGQKLKKSCVLVKDAPAFVVNRLLTRFLNEVTRAIDEGTPIEVADSALQPLGLPMSPMVLLELVGPAVAQHVAGTLHTAFPDRFSVSESMERLVAAGKRAVYLPGTTTVDPEVAALFHTGDSPSTAEELRRRALEALAQEIRIMLDEGVVAEAADIDLCMVLGAGWPFHLGGITPYLDREGVSERVTGARFTPRGVASLPG